MRSNIELVSRYVTLTKRPRHKVATVEEEIQTNKQTTKKRKDNFIEELAKSWLEIPSYTIALKNKTLIADLQ